MTAPSKTTAVVIGAGPGIGAAIARQLTAQGRRIVLIARTAGRLEILAATLRASVPVTIMQADASNAGGIADVIDAIRHDGPIGVVAYNAAYPGGRLSTAGLPVLRASLEVNVLSALAAVQAALPDLEATNGSVLFTGGGLALHPNPEAGVLSLGKAALRSAALILAAELAPRGIKVRTLTVAGAIAPGTAFDPDRIAGRLISLIDEDTAEAIYNG